MKISQEIWSVDKSVMNLIMFIDIPVFMKEEVRESASEPYKAKCRGRHQELHILLLLTKMFSCSLLVQQNQCLKSQGMPDLKVETLKGHPLRFQFFMTMFETDVEAKTQVPKERLAMLIEYQLGAKTFGRDLLLSRAISWIPKS